MLEEPWDSFQRYLSSMYEQSDKRRIYWAIEEFTSGRMPPKQFCDEFHFCFDLEVDLESLTTIENSVFTKLSEVVSRYSDHPSDFLALPKGFASFDELKSAVSLAMNVLSPQ